MGGVGPLVVVEGDPASDTGLGLRSSLPGVQVDTLILQRPPEAFDEDVVQVSGFAVHPLPGITRRERARMSKHNSVAKAIDYLMPPKGERWDAFTAFLDDGHVCLTNNAAERALRGIALGRKSWLFAGSERGGERAAFVYTLLVSCKMNDIDPQAWIADVLARMPDVTVSRLPELLHWNWKAEQEAVKAA